MVRILALVLAAAPLFGCRTGDYVVNAGTSPKKRPPATGPYPSAGQYPRKFLYGHPGLHGQLTTSLRSLAEP
jgi:hypothetical protein